MRPRHPFNIRVEVRSYASSTSLFSEPHHGRAGPPREQWSVEARTTETSAEQRALLTSVAPSGLPVVQPSRHLSHITLVI